MWADSVNVFLFNTYKSCVLVLVFLPSDTALVIPYILTLYPLIVKGDISLIFSYISFVDDNLLSYVISSTTFKFVGAYTLSTLYFL